MESVKTENVKTHYQKYKKTMDENLKAWRAKKRMEIFKKKALECEEVRNYIINEYLKNPLIKTR